MKTKLKKAPAKKVAVKRVTKKQTVTTETPVKRGPGRPKKVITEVVKKPEVILITPIIKTTNNTTKTISFSIPNDPYKDSGYVYTHDLPTGSCQLFSVAYFQHLKWIENQAKLVHKGKTIKVDYTPVISAIRRSVYNKNLLFIDVNNTMKSFVKEIFNKGEIITEAPYKSTNGSHMVLYTIDVRQF